MKGKEILEDLERILAGLLERNIGTPVVVEGKHDVDSLRNLGLKGEIISYNRGKGLVEFSEWLKEKYDSVILLTDWDTRGVQLMKGLREQLTALDITVQDDIWIELLKLVTKEIRCVEDLDNLIFRLREE